MKKENGHKLRFSQSTTAIFPFIYLKRTISINLQIMFTLPHYLLGIV